jgi:hypothetical protein
MVLDVVLQIDKGFIFAGFEMDQPVILTLGSCEPVTQEIQLRGFAQTGFAAQNKKPGCRCNICEGSGMGMEVLPVFTFGVLEKLTRSAVISRLTR